MPEQESAQRDAAGAPEGCGGHGAPAQPMSEALGRIRARLSPLEGSETLGVREALGRVLWEDVAATLDVPAHTNSAMDGYALAGAGLPAGGEKSFRVAGTAWAGRPYAGDLAEGSCVRIMTGAPLPAGTDTVVMQEDVRRDGETAWIGAGHRPGQHVRLAGEDLRAGATALARGSLLRPAHLGLLASLGIAEVRVRRRPRVAFFSTGDELQPVGRPLGEGQIHDSNRYTLWGMLTRLGVEVLDLGVVRDVESELEHALGDAAARADVIITSGGVSVGEADFVTLALRRLGEVGFWTVAMKPGRPLAFGRIGKAWFFGLPGNPVSAMATFYQLVQPALVQLMGVSEPDQPLLLRAVCRTRLKKSPGRREFQRGILAPIAAGRYEVSSTGQQGSGILRSMTEANCFIVLPEEAGRVEPGDEVLVQPFSALC